MGKVFGVGLLGLVVTETTATATRSTLSPSIRAVGRA
jgi:hypothetical protein